MKLRPLTEYNADARVIGDPKIGRDCWIGPFCILDASGGLEIGDHCTIAAGTHIYTHQSGAGRCSKIERKPVKIGSNVYVGPHVVISMGVTIGDEAMIGANSFVDADVAAGSRAWGNPATKQLVSRFRGGEIFSLPAGMSPNTDAVACPKCTRPAVGKDKRYYWCAECDYMWLWVGK